MASRGDGTAPALGEREELAGMDAELESAKRNLLRPVAALIFSAYI